MNFALIVSHRLLLSFLFSFLLPLSLQAQGFNYVHYNTQDGLAGSTVYDICQDKDGYLWFGTETGLSRYDGTHFKTFTVRDGLPANEIFGFYVDSHKRMWMNCLKNSVCYYLNGKVHNQENDTLLRRIKLNNRLTAFAENKDGDIIMYGWEDTVIVTVTGHVNTWTNYISKNKIFHAIYGMHHLPAGINALPDYIRHFVNNSFSILLAPDAQAFKKNMGYIGLLSNDYTGHLPDSLIIVNTKTTRAKTLKLPVNAFTAIPVNSHTIAVLKKDKGVLLYNTEDSTYSGEYLTEYIVQCVAEDDEGNLWFSTKGAGIFMLSLSKCRNYIGGHGVHHILKVNKTIYIGTDNNQYWKMPALEVNSFFSNGKTAPSKTTGNLDFLKYYKREVYFTCAGSDFLNLNHTWNCGSIKTIQVYHNTALVAAYSSCFTINLPSGKVERILYNGRTTCAIRQNRNFYIGTLNGLYEVTPHTEAHLVSMGNPLIACQINQVVNGTDSTLWIATGEKGVIGYKGGRIVAHFTQDNGLPSDIARCLFVAGNILWVGTNKGLCKIDIQPGHYKVRWHFGLEDGLNSQEINTIFCDSTLIYAGTPLGLSVFDETRSPHHATCTILLESVKVSGRKVNTRSGRLALKHKDNNIRFDYVCPSYLSSGDISYQYRLLGLSDKWQQTRETFLSYPTLPSGKYRLQLIAVNKFGDKGPTIEYSFEVQKLVTEELWFLVSIALLLILTIIFIIRYWISLLYRKEREKMITAQRIMESEQMALRAQMNPHFIFNCLNSVQQYILDRDEKKANFYLLRFAALVRQTLEHSAVIYIPLAEEIAYLKNYLELERLQLSESFSYSITMDEAIDPGLIKIPNMVLQPYVENAVKHGMGQLKGPEYITITFRILKEEQVLECRIEDNGPGIHATTKAQQTIQPLHRPRGMFITGKRIETLNQLSPAYKHISIRTIDLGDIGPGTGTRVIICFPLLYSKPI